MRARPPVAVPPTAWAIPEPSAADEWGVVGFGADLAPSTLVDAYRRGIFPWPHDDGPLPWFSPDPRGILPLDGLHVARSLRQRLRRSEWTTTVDAAFGAVVEGCARRSDREGTWITEEMRDAYGALHDLGWARSVEVWEGGALVGGCYGVQVGGIFTGESMFHRRDDASKVALVDLVARFAEAGGTAIDVQLTTAHLASLGVRDVPRPEYLALLHRHRDDDVRVELDRRPVSRLVHGRGAAPPPTPPPRRGGR